jgi:hypothetical protein
MLYFLAYRISYCQFLAPGNMWLTYANEKENNINWRTVSAHYSVDLPCLTQDNLTRQGESHASYH